MALTSRKCWHLSNLLARFGPALSRIPLNPKTGAQPGRTQKGKRALDPRPRTRNKSANQEQARSNLELTRCHSIRFDIGLPAELAVRVASCSRIGGHHAAFLPIESERLPVRKVAPPPDRRRGWTTVAGLDERPPKAPMRSHARASVPGAAITYIQELEMAPSARQQLWDPQ